MKTFKLFGFLLLCSILVITVFEFMNNEPVDIEIHGSNIVFEYNDLMNEAEVVALVEVKDKLSPKNSTVVYHENSPLIQFHYATREVEVKEYYKNSLNLPSDIKINESAAITKNNEYLHDEDYETLQKGKKYIVYLSTNNGLGELSLISNNNGKIDLENFSENQFTDIAIRSVLVANKVKPNSPEGWNINYDVQNNKKAQNNKLAKINKGNKHVDLPIVHYYDAETDKEYLNIDGIDLEIDGSVYN